MGPPGSVALSEGKQNARAPPNGEARRLSHKWAQALTTNVIFNETQYSVILPSVTRTS